VSGKYAAAHGLTPIAVIKGYADAAQVPNMFTVSPALAVPKALAMASWSVNDVDLFEVNEAFSVVALANAKLLDVGIDK